MGGGVPTKVSAINVNLTFSNMGFYTTALVMRKLQNELEFHNSHLIYTFDMISGQSLG